MFRDVTYTIPSRKSVRAKEMPGLLHGMDGLLSDLVAPLVGINPVDFHRITWRPGDDVPVVLLEGGPGMGKTAVFDWIAERYRNHAPIARVDLADRGRYPENAEDRLPQLLTDLRWLTPWGLSLGVEDNGHPLRFPRLSFALLAVAAGPPSGRLDHQGARQRLEGALSRVYPQVRTRDVTDWVGEVLSEFAAHMAPFPADVLIKATVLVIARRLFDRPHRRAALDWHKSYSRGPGDGLDALIALSADFHKGGLPREGAEKALVAALLDDVRSEYRGFAYLKRKSRPVLLLDNADAHPAGERILDLLLEHRASEAVDPLVVIAAGEGGVVRQHREHVMRTTSRYPLDVRTWERPDGGKAGVGLLVVELSELEPEHVLEMVRGVYQPDLDKLIHRLTQGLPLGVDAITAALAAAGDRASEGHCLLDLPCSDDRQDRVASRLLRRVVPSEDWRSRLITLSAAHDAEAAGELLPQRTVHDAKKLLQRHGWAQDPAYFVGNRFLRLLLLHELYRRDTGWTWTKVQQRLRDFHARRASREHARFKQTDADVASGDRRLDRHEARQLHHCLALGDVGTVVDRLEEGVVDAGSWLAALCVISSAPYFDRPDVREAAARGADTAEAGEPTARLVRRILHATWYLRDPFVPPNGNLIDGLKRDLEHLAERPGVSGAHLLFEAADSWSNLLRSWQQDLCPRLRGE